MRATLPILPFLLLASTALAQAPSATPAATAPAPRFVMTVPPGYEKVAAGGYTALVRPNDRDWVTKALTSVKPATRPTTMPIDVLKRAADNRAAVTKQIVADLALPDDKAVAAAFDEKIVPALKQLDQLKPPVYFLVCTRDQLKELTKTGWGEPRFHYNRVADSFSYDENVMLAIDRPMDDSVLPAFYKEDEPADTRAANLAKGIQELDASLAQMAAQQAPAVVYNRLAQLIGEQVFAPLKLRRDQEWLGMGATTYLGCKYTSALTGLPRDAMLRSMTYEDPRFPVSMRAIDLANPASDSSMRPAAVPYYTQSMRRRATLAVMKWTEQGGDGVITKAVTLVRKGLPDNGPALVKALEKETGAELAKYLAPQ